MNQIEELQFKLKQKFSTIEAIMDPPKHVSGRWFLDICLNNKFTTVEWKFGECFYIEDPITRKISSVDNALDALSKYLDSK